MHKKRRRAQFSIRAELTRLSVSVAEPGCFYRGGQEGPANSLGWHINLHYFNIKMWLTIKYLTILVPKTQVNTVDFYLIVIEIFVNYCIT